MSVSGAGLLDLGMQLAGHRVVLIVAIALSSKDKVNIRVRVCPTGERIYLSPGLQLTAFDASGATSPELETQARSGDNLIQLEFSGELREQFSVKMTLGDVSTEENFLI